MKKLFYSLFAFAALAMTNTSCSDELENAGTNANEVAVTFNVQLENTTGSRAAIGDGTTATELQYAVYKADGNGIGTIIKSLSKETTVKPDLTAEVTFRLVKGQTYNFMFWAQKPGVSATDEIADNAYYKVDKTLGKVSIDYKTNKDANDEGRDAFYAVEKTLKVNGPINKTIILKRPFAQINVGTTIGSLKDAATADVNITKSSMTIKKAANKLDIYTGKVSASADAEDVTYILADIPELTEAPTDEAGGLKNVTINNETKDYEYLAMNYILVDDHNQVNNVEDGSNNASVNVDFTIYDDKDVAINTFEVPNVTVQRNWRTNIIGDIMNENVTFNVVIDPKFDNDHNYKVEEQLAYAAVNGGEVTLQEDVVLTEPLNITANMILNMNGKTLTGSLNVAEGVNVKVNNGTIDNQDDATSGIVSNGDLTLNDVVITSARHALRIESGNVVINGGTYKVAPISNKTLYALNVGDGLTSVANVTIKGGTFIGPKGTIADSGGAVTVKEGSTVTIEGGDFSGGKNNTLSSKGTLTITGGSFDQDPAAWIASGYTTINQDGKYVVGKPAASVDDLTNALNNETTVNVTNAIDNGSNVIAINDNDVVLNMEGNEVKAGGQGTNNYAFNISGSNVEVNDANINGAGFAVLNESSVTVNSGTIEAKPGKSGRNMFYVIGNSTVTVNEGTYTFDRTSCYFVYVEAGSTCYINGGHYEKPLANNASKDSFVNNASTGTVIITGGTFNVDPTKWLAEGYKAVKNGKYWTVSAE